MRLYHFSKAKYAVQNVQKSRLKVSLFGDMNDPFELLAANVQRKRDRRALMDWVEQKASQTGIICLSKSWRDPVMWSHYADRYRGIVLGFEVDERRIKKVQYEKGRLNIQLQATSGTRRPSPDDEQRLLTTKFSRWSYEKEYRILVDLHEVEKEGALYFQTFADWLILKEIRLGHNCTVTTNEAEQLAESASGRVAVYKTRRAFGRFAVVLDQRYERKVGRSSI